MPKPNKPAAVESLRAELGNMAGAIGAASLTATAEELRELEAGMKVLREKAEEISKREIKT